MDQQIFFYKDLLPAYVRNQKVMIKSNLCLIFPSTRREDFSVEKKSTEDDWGGGGEAGVLLPDKSCHPRRPRSLTCQTQQSELTHRSAYFYNYFTKDPKCFRIEQNNIYCYIQFSLYSIAIHCQLYTHISIKANQKHFFTFI